MGEHNAGPVEGFDLEIFFEATRLEVMQNIPLKITTVVRSNRGFMSHVKAKKKF